MRQLKGKVAKENAKQKAERRNAFKQGHAQVLTVALPVIIVIVSLIVLYVVAKTTK